MSNHKDILTQTFNSPLVNLEINSFKDMDFWKEQMVTNSLKDIWKFIEWIIPVDVFNVHNYQTIEKRFVGVPTNQRIFDLLRDNPLYYSVVRINLHAPLTESRIFIFNSKEEALLSGKYNSDSIIIRDSKKQFQIKKYIVPGTSCNVSLLNQFSFYQEFVKYTSLGNSNNGRYTFILTDGTMTETDKMCIGRSRKIDWRGAAFENSVPIRDRSRSKYYMIEDNLKDIQGDISFFEVFKKFHQRVDAYITSVNGDASRVRYAERFAPIPYTKSDHLMRLLRHHYSRLCLKTSDFDQPITPYLEIGKEVSDFTYGVISR